MKRSSVVLTLASCAILFFGAENVRWSEKQKAKKVCSRGYTVIEASLGIDCNGDTIQLQKVAGFYQPVFAKR